MPDLRCERVEQRVGNAGAEAGVWATLVVVSHPLAQNGPKVPFIQQDQPIQTLTTDRANQSLAERVGLRAANRRFQHRQPFAIQSRCGTAIPRVNGPPSRAVTAEAAFAEAPAVGAATRAPRAGGRRANAPILVASGGARRARTSSPRSVSVVGRNINCRNRNGLFSRHRDGDAPRPTKPLYCIAR
jgi:hypothetical protein